MLQLMFCTYTKCLKYFDIPSVRELYWSGNMNRSGAVYCLYVVCELCILRVFVVLLFVSDWLI